MRRLVECVPNFSEGRRKEVIDQIVAEITGVRGAQLLDLQMDADHNRAVVTFAGQPESVEEAAFRAVKKAAELIDMEEHQGEHPRIGATDVVPFIPLRRVTQQGKNITDVLFFHLDDYGFQLSLAMPHAGKIMHRRHSQKCLQLVNNFHS